VIGAAERRLIARSWTGCAPRADALAAGYYQRLFERMPGLRIRFPADLAPARLRLVGLLRFVARSLDWPAEEWRRPVPIEEDLLAILLAMSRRYRGLGEVDDSVRAASREALTASFAEILGKEASGEIGEAWAQVHDLAADAFVLGASALARLHQPAVLAAETRRWARPAS
jgi:hypothetical protein